MVRMTPMPAAIGVIRAIRGIKKGRVKDFLTRPFLSLWSLTL
jgi:hypothetical protein